jgi:hypothetical protein
MRAVVNFRLCEIAAALELIAVTSYKRSVHPITNPIPVYIHSYTWQYKEALGKILSQLFVID